MRSKRAKKHEILPDSIHRSRIVTRVINKVMLDGKKSIAETIVYTAIDKLNEDPKAALNIFEEAVRNVMPKQEVRSRRVGGTTYQIPYPTKHDRAEALAIRWIVDSARAKKGEDMTVRLFKEISDAHEGVGNAIRKRDDTHKMADSNKAFAHFRF